MVNPFNPSQPLTRPTQANADNKDLIHVQLHQQLPDAIGELRTGLSQAISAINQELALKTDQAGFVEAAQDATAALIKAGTNVTVAYDDANNTFTINATAGSGGTTDPEIVRDTIGGALVPGSGIQILVNDAGDSITISVAAIPASAITTGVFAPSRLGSGTPTSSTVLYGDGTWKAAPGGGAYAMQGVVLASTATAPSDLPAGALVIRRS